MQLSGNQIVRDISSNADYLEYLAMLLLDRGRANIECPGPCSEPTPSSVVRYFDTTTNWVLPRPVLMDESFVDNNRCSIIALVICSKRASHQNRNAEGCEIIFPDRVPVG